MPAARLRGSYVLLLPPRTAGEMQRFIGAFGESIGEPNERSASAPQSISREARSFLSASASISVWLGVFSTTGKAEEDDDGGGWLAGEVEDAAPQRVSSDAEEGTMAVSTEN